MLPSFSSSIPFLFQRSAFFATASNTTRLKSGQTPSLFTDPSNTNLPWKKRKVSYGSYLFETLTLTGVATALGFTAMGLFFSEKPLQIKFKVDPPSEPTPEHPSPNPLLVNGTFYENTDFSEKIRTQQIQDAETSPIYPIVQSVHSFYRESKDFAEIILSTSQDHWQLLMDRLNTNVDLIDVNHVVDYYVKPATITFAPYFGAIIVSKLKSLRSPLFRIPFVLLVGTAGQFVVQPERATQYARYLLNKPEKKVETPSLFE